jgi:integrase
MGMRLVALVDASARPADRRHRLDVEPEPMQRADHERPRRQFMLQRRMLLDVGLRPDDFAVLVDLFTISRRLGHSSASMTPDVYGHVWEGADAAAKAIEGVLK